MIKAFYAFLVAIPEILKFIRLIQEQQQEKADAQNLKEKMKKVNEAFEEKNADKLNDAFNS